MAWSIWHLLWALFLTMACLLFSYLLLYRNRSCGSDTVGLFQSSQYSMPDSEGIHPDSSTVDTTTARLVSAAKVKQPYDAFLLLDVEATCQRGTNFDYPNEIIEFPVCLMRWKDRVGGQASRLEVVDEFRSFVKPSWKPALSKFCTELTGITQEQVDTAPSFPDVLRSFRAFLVKHSLLEKNGKRRLRFCWCSDGPFDIRDFVVKQCFISQIPMPDWMTGDVLDVRSVVMSHTAKKAQRGPFPKLGTLNIPGQLLALGLPPFLGRQHSGIDDTRNLARIMTQLAIEGVRLQPNTRINPRRRWSWMGKSGQILEEHLQPDSRYKFL